MAENFCVFVELLAEADSDSFFVAGAVDNRIGVVYLFGSCFGIFFDGFLMIGEVVDTLFDLTLERIVNHSKE